MIMAKVDLLRNVDSLPDFMTGAQAYDEAFARQFGSEPLFWVDPCNGCQFREVCDPDSCGLSQG